MVFIWKCHPTRPCTNIFSSHGWQKYPYSRMLLWRGCSPRARGSCCGWRGATSRGTPRSLQQTCRRCATVFGMKMTIRREGFAYLEPPRQCQCRGRCGQGGGGRRSPGPPPWTRSSSAGCRNTEEQTCKRCLTIYRPWGMRSRWSARWWRCSGGRRGSRTGCAASGTDWSWRRII